MVSSCFEKSLSSASKWLPTFDKVCVDRQKIDMSDNTPKDWGFGEYGKEMQDKNSCMEQTYCYGRINNRLDKKRSLKWIHSP